MKNFFSVSDVFNVQSLVKDALLIKKNPYTFRVKNKTLGLVFFNPSLRTRLSTQKAAFNLGCTTWMLNIDNSSWKIETQDGVIMHNTQEHIKEAISVMSTYCDILAVRTFPSLKDKEYDYKETFFRKIQTYSKVPVVNLESATEHPLQALADAITIEEYKPNKNRIKVVLSWAPHPKALPHAVPNSFAECITKLKYTDLIITHPKGYELDKKFTNYAANIVYDQDKAFKEADFIYAKNWSSYIKSYGKVVSKDKNWMITLSKMEKTDNAKFMHCLPVRRNLVVEDPVLDSNTSIVLKQAENRIFAAQTVLKNILI